MYDERLGTDWTELAPGEAIRRAYALGVAAAFGYENRAEFDRLREALDTSYDRSIIDLAYQEGRQEAAALRGAETADTDRDAVWSELVEGEVPGERREAGGPGADGGPPGPTGSLPEATELPELLGRTDVLDGGGDLGALSFPDLLGGSPTRGTGEGEDG